MKDLTDTQIRVLIWLVDQARDDRDARVERRWHEMVEVSRQSRVARATVATAEVLAREGSFVEIRYRMPLVLPEVRATDEGIALCDGMGD